MIDTHCHILPFLDDGAADWDAALAMARRATEDGIRQCIATPHWTGEPDGAERARARLEELRRRLAEAGLPLCVHAGHEVVLVPNLGEALRAGQVFTLAGSNYLLVETAQFEYGAYLQSALFRLQSEGYRILLAHPERVPLWQRSPEGLQELLERGCYLQVNAGSLLGRFGRAARRTAEGFLRRGWVSLLASDAHGPVSRPPRLAEAARRVAAIVSEAMARRLVEENPARILCNEELPYIDAEPVRPRFAFPWWPRRTGWP